MKLKPTILFTALMASAILTTGSIRATLITQNLGGLLTPTGAATNGNKDRQYAFTTSGGEVTLTYTLSTSSGNLSNTFDFDNLFRYPQPGTDINIPSGQSLTITINSIVANLGLTLNSVAMSDTVTVAIEGGRTARFSVNGGSTFDYVGTGSPPSVSQQSVTNTQFTNFNGVGDSLSLLNVSQTTNGGQNLRNLEMTFEVVPEPGSLAMLAFGMIGLWIVNIRTSGAYRGKHFTKTAED